jgi:hypothetical protein
MKDERVLDPTTLLLLLLFSCSLVRKGGELFVHSEEPVNRPRDVCESGLQELIRNKNLFQFLSL